MKDGCNWPLYQQTDKQVLNWMHEMKWRHTYKRSNFRTVVLYKANYLHSFIKYK